MTSETHPIRVDWIETGLWPGRLGLTFAPGKKGASVLQAGVTHDRDLAADLGCLAREGVNVLAPLIEAHEFELLGIPDYHALASARGLAVIAFPVRDRDVPADLAAFNDFLDELMEQLLDGRAVVVHCRGGLGRAGLTAACLLTRVGLPPEQATGRVRAARPGAIETAAQERFVEDFATR
jgi:protein-tyrosine phosphatase